MSIRFFRSLIASHRVRVAATVVSVLGVPLILLVVATHNEPAPKAALPSVETQLQVNKYTLDYATTTDDSLGDPSVPTSRWIAPLHSNKPAINVTNHLVGDIETSDLSANSVDSCIPVSHNDVEAALQETVPALKITAETWQQKFRSTQSGVWMGIVHLTIDGVPVDIACSHILSGE